MVRQWVEWRGREWSPGRDFGGEAGSGDFGVVLVVILIARESW